MTCWGASTLVFVKKGKGKNMKKILFVAAMLAVASVDAQLAKGSKKFLGNITTNYAVRSDFPTYWNQITGENECKWQSVENTQNVMQWGGCDKVYKYAKDNGIPFKFHTLVWGAQYPGFDGANPGNGWFDKLTPAQQLKEITEWFDAAAARYPDADMIDVVNEAVQGHATGIQYWKDALGGNGTTGYDWIIKAFKMARERWPKAMLVYNDFNELTYQKDEFIALMKEIKKSGYVDAMGFQAHGWEIMDAATLKTRLEACHNAVGLPIVISEYDVNLADDTEQKNKLAEQFPIFWEADYVIGVTFWGYVYGATWVANSGLLNASGGDRPAFTWLKSYMATHLNVASQYDWNNAGGPKFTTAPNLSVEQGITAVTTMATEAAATFTISGGADAAKFSLTGAALSFKQAPTFATPGDANTDNVYEVEITATSGTTSSVLTLKISITEPRTPFKGTALAIPGIIEAEDYDLGGEGKGYHEANTLGNQGAATLRPNDQVDIEVTSDTAGAHSIGYTLTGEWLVYSVDVKTEGEYELKLRVATNSEGGAMHLELDGVQLSDTIALPNTGGWTTWQTITLPKFSLTAGKHDLKVMFDSDYINLNWMEFISISTTGVHSPAVPASPALVRSLSTMEFQIVWNGSFDYQIVHFDGTLVEMGKGNNQVNIGRSMAPGIYVLKIDHSSGAKSVHKIMKK